MKFRFSILFFILLSLSAYANKIDDLKTDEDVTKFINKLNPKFKKWQIKIQPIDYLYLDAEERKRADSLGVKEWGKADFNGDGETDLFAMSSRNNMFIILTDGDKFRTLSVPTLFYDENLCYPIVINQGGNASLRVYKFKKYYHSVPYTTEDTVNQKIHYYSKNICDSTTITNYNLVYKLGGFIEENNSPGNYKIEKIEFSASACFGECPIFNLTINNDRNSIYNAIKYNDKQGSFKATIGKGSYDSILDVLNYIDFPLLKSDYSVGVTDQPTVDLKITYDNGKIKEINDYGEQGTYGLELLYDRLFDLRTNQNWK